MFTLTDPLLYTVACSSGIPDETEKTKYVSLKPNINHIWCNTERFQPVVRECYDSLKEQDILYVLDDYNQKHKVKLSKITARYIDETTQNIVINWASEHVKPNL